MRRQMILTTAMGFLVASISHAQDKAVPQHDARVLRETLREVINTGAELFNTQGDHAGCYRLFQGSLLSIRSVLPPELQDTITQALKTAERLPRYSDKAFELRKAIDAVRDWANVGGEGKVAAPKKGEGVAAPKKESTAKPPAPKPVVAPKKESTAKPPAPKQDPEAGTVAGKVTFQGRPAPPGFITLVSEAGRRFSASILPDGTYQFKLGLAPGEYRVAIERTPGAEIPKKLDIPERFRQETTSGLRVTIQRGKQTLDFDLVQ